MAWTTPRTWVAGETVTAALMNAHVRDNLIAVHDTETVAPSRLTGYPTDVTKVLKGDGTWATVVNATVSASAAIALSKMAEPLWVELQYTEITSNATVASSTEATPTTVVQGASLAVAARPLLVEFFAPYVNSNDPANAYHLNLWEGSTNKGRLLYVNTYSHACHVAFRYTPSAASYVFKIAAFNTAGSGGTIYAGAGGAGAYVPAFLRISQASA